MIKRWDLMWCLLLKKALSFFRKWGILALYKTPVQKKELKKWRMLY